MRLKTKATPICRRRSGPSASGRKPPQCPPLTKPRDRPADDVEPWCELRPMTPDSRPINGWSPIDSLFINSGHGMLGWTLSYGSAAADGGHDRLQPLGHRDQSVCPALPNGRYVANERAAPSGSGRDCTSIPRCDGQIPSSGMPPQTKLSHAPFPACCGTDGPGPVSQLAFLPR